MKASCLQETMRRGLHVTKRVTPARTSLPITQNTLIRTRDGSLELTATNLEMTVRMTLPATIEEHGETTLPNTLLTGFVDTLPKEVLVLEKSPDRETMKLKCGTAKANINGETADHFPPVPVVENPICARINADEFRKALRRVVFCAASDNGRPALTGIMMALEGNQLTTVGADGFRLGVQHSELSESVEERRQVLVPARVLSEILHMMTGAGNSVEILIPENEKNIRFCIGDEDDDGEAMLLEITSLLITGGFPNYEDLIPRELSNRAVFDLSELSHAARRAGLFARDESRTVKLSMAREAGGLGKAVISSEAKDLGNNRAEVTMSEMKGDPINISFNNKYILDVLGCIESKEVILETSNPTTPAKITIPDSEEYTHVMMPVVTLET